MSNLLPWNYHKTPQKRRVDTKEVLPAILIVCEGEKTEPNYFRSFPVRSARVQVGGDGMSTVSLVKETVRMVEEAKSNGKTYDQVWCVFDKDGFPDSHFNESISLCEQYGFKAAYSNESFELWYLLHFIYCDTALSRNAYIKKLSVHLGKKYRKNDKEMFRLLLPYQKTAIQNARKLESKAFGKSPAKNNPVTKVLLLVEELNKLSA